MALVPLGIFYGGVMTGIPVVTGVAEGVHHQRNQNAEAADDTRMVKFYLDSFCTPNTPQGREVNASIVVLRGDRLWLSPTDETSGLPVDGSHHPFTGFYIQYPDEERSPPQRGLVSTISVDPPMLNWIYVDRETLGLRYGNRTASIAHVVGPWDWTDDEVGVTLEGWEGFCAVEVPEEDRLDGLKWALYYDIDNDKMGGGEMVGGATVLQVSLERRILPEDLRRQQEEAADQKMQVTSHGDMKAQWGGKAVS
ncbi:hypothetical protein EJ05DRAFT_472382 [Pseudovirgaria hyperparasitica]|uniref:Uncharacterized protein n=1 Tax=Pseudovirgaria hyperparasitica TaxID=470096 RepID=A0A6A6WMQ3_9PEZI|nr:uncharacterized protein EJ05DRAFT_472382 [Pseudovirgaria hyperparasitica]KAF2763491.1 hypothetical protein EJ05DRAFT_472382 [Pseudovirgaria hyperparasitica]